jgi:hypothetical protein
VEALDRKRRGSRLVIQWLERIRANTGRRETVKVYPDGSLRLNISSERAS